MSLNRCSIVSLGPLALLAACEAKTFQDYGSQDLHYAEPTDAGSEDAQVVALADSGAAGQLCTPVATCQADDPPDVLCSTPSSASTASVHGVVVVPEGTKAGGSYELEGTLMVFASKSSEGQSVCPSDDAPPSPAFLALECGNLGGGVEVPFTLEGVPVSEEPWQILAFLDVNGNQVVDPCDMSARPASASVSQPGELTLNAPIRLEVSAVLLVPVCGLPACK